MRWGGQSKGSAANGEMKQRMGIGVGGMAAPETGLGVDSFVNKGISTRRACSVTPSGGAASTTLTITAPALASAKEPGFGPRLPVAALAIAVCLFGWRRGRRSLWLLLLGAVVLGSGLITACGGGGGSSSGGGSGSGSTPVTSTVTVTATAGSLQQTATITVTMN